MCLPGAHFVARMRGDLAVQRGKIKKINKEKKEQVCDDFVEKERERWRRKPIFLVKRLSGTSGETGTKATYMSMKKK